MPSGWFLTTGRRTQQYAFQTKKRNVMAIVRKVTHFEDIKVEEVTSFPDLYVFVTQQKSDARGHDHIWFFEDSFPEIKVRFVSHFPDLKIQFVDHRISAGWRNKSHALVGKIAK